MELDQWSKKDTKTSNKTILYSDICLEKKRQPNPHFFCHLQHLKKLDLPGESAYKLRNCIEKTTTGKNPRLVGYLWPARRFWHVNKVVHLFIYSKENAEIKIIICVVAKRRLFKNHYWICYFWKLIIITASTIFKCICFNRCVRTRLSKKVNDNRCFKCFLSSVCACYIHKAKALIIGQNALSLRFKRG